MRFKVIPPSRSLPALHEPTFVLMQDNWNDYGFRTQYHLFWVTPETELGLGAVKILKRGQKDTDPLLIQRDFDRLPEEFVSIGESLDFYQHLSQFGIPVRNDVLNALRDVAMMPALKEKFQSERGWGKSLFRDQTESGIREFLTLASALVHSDYTSVPQEGLTFSFQMPGWSEPATFDFSLVPIKSEVWKKKYLPGRMIVLIGRNASGKSTLLARLARVAHGSSSKRAQGAFDNFGKIDPIGIGFPRIVTVSYSAFDSFALPGVAPRPGAQEPDEREQIVRDARHGEGRFVFCGLRDIASELQAQISAYPELPYAAASDRVAVTKLKPIETLAEEFRHTLEVVARSDAEATFNHALALLASDPSFSFMQDRDLSSLRAGNPPSEFLGWSTGHKIVLQAVASLCAYVVPRSLVLIDEPETHLHPPLLAALMHAVRYILERNKAFAIVATHSPVVLQETLARNVLLMHREGSETRLVPMHVETFGENVGTLTNEVFGLNSEVTDFHRILNLLCDELGDVKLIEERFVPHGLSFQARAYVLSRLAKKA